jgi:hypothetical protein
VIVHVLILWGVISAAAALGVVVHQDNGRRGAGIPVRIDFRRGGLRSVVGSVGGLRVVIYVGASLVFLLLVVHYASRPAGRVVALGSAVVLMTVVISVLGMLDQPFGIGARVQPDKMRQAIELVLTDERNPAILQPCQ